MALSEPLPFDVELERRPVWVDVASALVIVLGIPIALKLLPMIALLPPLVASAIGRRLGSSAVHVTVDEGALALGDNEIASEDVRDVWLDDDGVDPRVVVSWNAPRDAHRIAALGFENRPQAVRFRARARAKGCRRLVAGTSPAQNRSPRAASLRRDRGRVHRARLVVRRARARLLRHGRVRVRPREAARRARRRHRSRSRAPSVKRRFKRTDVTKRRRRRRRHHAGQVERRQAR